MYSTCVVQARCSAWQGAPRTLEIKCQVHKPRCFLLHNSPGADMVTPSLPRQTIFVYRLSTYCDVRLSHPFKTKGEDVAVYRGHMRVPDAIV